MEPQSTRTLRKKRTSNFSDDETKLLIQLWGSPYIQNKLFLAYRKTPIMCILAAKMQQRGFYRTHEEIRTRIRYLKYLYHRSKRSTSSGTGIGTVDPAWRHFKAMDAILSKEGQKRVERIEEGVLEGPRCEDIQELVDIDINDDMESWATNDSIGSETSGDLPPLPALYHRIKRSTSSGTGVGTVDPDLPHFKAMDAILSKEGQKRVEPIEEGVLEGPRCEDIKQEGDIDINDDMESWATNDSIKSETSEDLPPLPVLKPAPSLKPKFKEVENQNHAKHMPTVLPSFTIPTQNDHITTNSALKSGDVPSIPLPLLILHSFQPQQAIQDKSRRSPGSSNGNSNEKIPHDLNNVLKELLEVQKENLDIQKQQLELEKQRLDFDRDVGSQLLTLVPMIGGISQRLALSTSQDFASNPSGIGKGRKRQNSEEIDILKDSKILRTLLEQPIRKYMPGKENDNDDDKENENDSVIPNEDNSDCSNK